MTGRPNITVAISAHTRANNKETGGREKEEDVVEEEVERQGDEGEIRILGKTSKDLRFADEATSNLPRKHDYNLSSLSPCSLQGMLNTLNKESKRLGLEINIRKIEVMVAGRVEKRVVVTLDGTRPETVE